MVVAQPKVEARFGRPWTGATVILNRIDSMPDSNAAVRYAAGVLDKARAMRPMILA
jgi:hypothetical protein